jgi:rhodanese-related sulfurtransferase
MVAPTPISVACSKMSGHDVTESLPCCFEVNGDGTHAKLLTRLEAQGVTLLDVRPEHEYALGHLPGAINIPLEELARRMAELPRDQEVVAYCRGAYCALSADAVTALRAQGWRARRLASGFPEWQAAGLRVETAG